MEKLAVIVDGGFVRAKLCQVNKAQPDANTIYQKINTIIEPIIEKDIELFRIFYYDCIPDQHDRKLFKHPVDGSRKPLFAADSIAFQNKVFNELKKKSQLAFRYGELSYGGWSIKSPSTFRKRIENGNPVRLVDVTLNINQKGTDIKMGLDIAWIAIKNIVEHICIIAGDSDLVPAMKFARKEGLTVHLSTMNHGVNKSMIEHCDFHLI
jgi:uncharacterized LabA/DUF88 family protein